MKIVIDTNVLISALLWHGKPNQILKLIEEGKYTLCTTPSLINELKNVLNRFKFTSRIKILNTSVEELVKSVFDLAELYPDKQIESVVKNDPEDDKILSCAITAGAMYVITGDSHLLDLKVFSSINILYPHQFILVNKTSNE